jgi:hypothetical protein
MAIPGPRRGIPVKEGTGVSLAAVVVIVDSAGVLSNIVSIILEEQIGRGPLLRVRCASSWRG